MNKNIIIAILVIIIIAIGAAFVLGQTNGKTNTQINIINNETFQNGEQVKFELKDAQGNALSGKTVEVSINNQKFTITTDQSGKGYISVNGLSSGKYDVEVKYAGDDKYNGCEAKATITFDADSPADNPSAQTGSAVAGTSSSSNSNSDTSGWTYYEKWGVWVDQNGIVVRVGDGSGEQGGVGYTIDDYIKFRTGEKIPPGYENYTNTTSTT